LDYHEAPAFLEALQKRQGIAARALEVTLLTGLRTGEVIGAKWTEIDLDRQIWAIPIERLKDRRTRSELHRVPLSPDVIDVLNGISGLSDFVFPGQRTGKPLSNMAMLGVLKDMNQSEFGKPIWVDHRSGRPITPHGLRATFRTWGKMQDLPGSYSKKHLGIRSAAPWKGRIAEQTASIGDAP
jgi:integrase